MNRYSDVVEVEVENVLVSDNNFLVILRERHNRKRIVPISVGVFEANGILMALEQVVNRRPFTYDIMKTILTGFNLNIQKLIISELRNDIFYGILFISDGKAVQEFDIRPSDGIALALRYNSPIFVAEQVYSTLEEENKNKPGTTIAPADSIDNDEEPDAFESDDAALEEEPDENQNARQSEFLRDLLYSKNESGNAESIHDKIRVMTSELDTAVNDERFEDAARIRDAINELKKRL
jgi:bifunctional DNase/RNase